LNRSGTAGRTGEAPSIGRLRRRISDGLGTVDWTTGRHRLLDGFWLKECVVVGFLGFGVEVRCLSCGV